MKKNDALGGREIYLEFRPVGNLMKVTAVDAATLVEVSISGPRNTSEQILKTQAGKMLEYRLRKEGHIE